MKNNTLNIYNTFTGFTQLIINIKMHCKCCKCLKTALNKLILCPIDPIEVKKQIYNGSFCNVLINYVLFEIIYRIYNIYNPTHTYKPGKKKQFKNQSIWKPLKSVS